MEIRTIKIAVLPVSEPVFSDRGTFIEIDDHAAGEFVIVTQPARETNEEKGIAFDPTEWPTIREAIDKMILQCRG